MFSKLTFATLAVAVLAVIASPASPSIPAPVPSGTATAYVPGPFPTSKTAKVDSEAGAATGVGELYVCVNAGFVQPCQWILYFSNTCTNVPTNFQDNVSAVTPQDGSVCTLYRDVNCGGQFIVTIPPGYSNLADQGFNDRLTSFVCT